MKAYEAKKLIIENGAQTTLQTVFDSFGKPYKCPNCQGTGFYMKEVVIPNDDPSWFYPPTVRHEKTECPLCNGHGWTEKEYKPKMVQSGWEVQE